MTITIIAVLFCGTLASPALAQTESWSVGGGYFTLPNFDGDADDSGMYACAVMRSSQYMLEIDYSIDSPGFLILAADYLYPLSEGDSYFGGSAYIGAGYTYFSADDIDNVSGFNALIGADLGNGLMGTVRYDFLGSDQELFTIGITYSFN